MKSRLKSRARNLRQNMTPHEVRLWACLRGWLQSRGFTVYRAWNYEVDDNIDAVLDGLRTIVDQLRGPSP